MLLQEVGCGAQLAMPMEELLSEDHGQNKVLLDPFPAGQFATLLQQPN